MLISIKKKIVILSMPKTGTTALEAALAPHCDIHYTGEPRVKHMPVRRFERFVRPYLHDLSGERFDLVCMMREPLDWLGSWFRYRRRPALEGHRNSTAEMDFDAFVRAYLLEDKPAPAKVGRPFRFVTRADNSVGIDRLFKYENSETYHAFLSERFEVPLAPARMNVSPEMVLELASSTRNAAEAALAEDYRIWRDVAE